MHMDTQTSDPPHERRPRQIHLQLEARQTATDEESFAHGVIDDMIKSPEFHHPHLRSPHQQAWMFDLWHVGLCLFYISTGRYPWQSTAPATSSKMDLVLWKEWMDKICRGEPLVFDGVVPYHTALFEKYLAPNPTHRHPLAELVPFWKEEIDGQLVGSIFVRNKDMDKLSAAIASIVAECSYEQIRHSSLWGYGVHLPLTRGWSTY
ncbi:Aste57867_3913 [Aphanomyces stellatus]|uniref:Aste57867_3913 protein n=1 Tax=Aphanomyces stellatus TaxID=120398 RepID=A0A485KEG7_9STRA|nr:hypothetical protein As57867_003902 [Aphanomyces stellatus]VFT81052.1 Aste57867_3913 [Aphanomyces stellatus]